MLYLGNQKRENKCRQTNLSIMQGYSYPMWNRLDASSLLYGTITEGLISVPSQCFRGHHPKHYHRSRGIHKIIY